MDTNKSEIEAEKPVNGSVVLQYDDQFPPLPMSNQPKYVHNYSKLQFSTNQTNAGKSSNVTQTLIVPLSERRFASRENSVKHSEAQKRICQNVAQKCGVALEFNNSGLKDNQNLSVFISGPLEKVVEAKKILSKELQTQTQLQLSVPKEFHRFLLGRNGANLREIENNSSTNITVPRSNEESDIVTIFGTKDGIERARHDIGEIVAERSKLGSERVTVAKKCLPFINGPNNSFINRIRDSTNAKINIPPPQNDCDDVIIVINGEKDGVNEAKLIIEKICEEIRCKYSSLNLTIAKSQHRYIIGQRGSGITEILEKTGVFVDIPLLGSGDGDSEGTVSLFGPSERLPAALSLVIQKAESMLCVTVHCANWLHRFIIGRGGSELNRLLERHPGCTVNFREDCAVLEGPREEVEGLREEVGRQAELLERTMAVGEVRVDPRFHRHVIGRGGANIQRLQEECKVAIKMPSGDGWSVCVEGECEGVRQVTRELEALAVKLENEEAREVVLDHRYHNHLIGAQGTKLRELRTQFPEVVVNFPDSKLKSDVVQLRGPRQQVEGLAKRLLELVEEVSELNYVREIRVAKECHKNVIGKGGATLRKMLEGGGVRAEFPEQGSESEVVRLTGRRKEVREAVRRVQELEAQLVSVKEASVSVPHRLHTSLIGVRGKLIQGLQEECGGVAIQFPPSDSDSDVIVVRGKASDVEKACLRLRELSEKQQLLSYQEAVAVKSEYHKFLIGKKGAKMTEFRKRHEGVLVVFPDGEEEKEEERNVVLLVGEKAAVARARAELEVTVKVMEEEEERWVTVAPQWHRHFFKRRQAVLEELGREFGGVRVFFPRMGAVEDVDRVRVVGPRGGCVEAAVARVRDILENLEAQTCVTVFIEQRHHRNLLSRNMAEIRAIQAEFDVAIKFPSRVEPPVVSAVAEQQQPDEEAPLSWSDETEDHEKPGEKQQEESEESDPCNLVTISGRKEQCEQASDSLLALVPVTEEVALVNEYHRNLIGQKGQGINTFSSKYNVVVNIPQANKNLDFITVKGTVANIAACKLGLAEMVDVWDKEKQDRLARNFELSLEVPSKFHRQIIGQKGANIELFRNQYSVNIQIPDQNSGSSTIIIRGYKEDTERAAIELSAIVSRLEAQVKEELHIPREVHPLLIGTRGINLRKLRQLYKVEINFPNRDAEGEQAQLVIVLGDKENVDKCCDHLVERANELLEEFEEKQQFRGPTNNHNVNSQEQRRNGNNNKAQSEFMLSGAPWQQAIPNAQSNDDFPIFDAGGDKSFMTTNCLSNGHSE